MKRAHSKSVPPPRSSGPGNNYMPGPPPSMANYDARYPTIWPYNRVDTSPPPPYTSREGSQQSSSPSAPAPSSRSPRIPTEHRAKPQASTEYTPLLEDFTRKFVESQLSVPSGQQAQGSTVNPLVPPELLVLCQQQSPYNPNFDSVSTASSNTSFTMSEYSRRNSISQSAASSCGIFSGSYSHLRWFTSNFILLFTLLSFNLGMLISPQFYSNFFLVLHTSNSTENDHHVSKSMLIDLLVASLMQIVLSIIATASGLILIYSACKVLATLRKRFQLSVKYRIHMSNQTPFPWFFITYERIAYETLGAFAARLLSLILAVYLFGVSALYVLLLSDYLDMLLSLVTYDHIRQLFCQQHAWYLNHDFMISIWLTAVVLTCFGVNSFRRNNKHNSSLSLLKHLATFAGAFAAAYLIFLVIYIFSTSNPPSQGNLLKAKRVLYSSDSEKLVCIRSDATFDWACLNKNWILLISSVPLLIMPFHLNELLITLLFASKHNQPLPGKSMTVVAAAPAAVVPPADLPPSSTNVAASRAASRSARHFADMHHTGTALHHPPRRFQFGEESDPYWGQQLETHTLLDDTIIATEAMAVASPQQPLEASPAMHLTSLSSLFSRPLHSFASVRTLFISVSTAVCLLNIIVNVFVYISALNATTSGFNDIHATRADLSWLPSRVRSRLPDLENNLLLLDFNFLRNYLHTIEPTSDGAGDRKQTWQRYLLIAASAFLLLKTTLAYLLFAFRAMLAHQTLTSDTKQDVLSGGQRTGCCLSSLLFTSPFIVWNLLVLLFSLFVERSATLLHFVLLTIGWLGCFLVFIYPALILLYFSFQSLQKNTLAFTSSYALLSIAFKPLRWAKSCFMLGVCLLATGLFYLVFWLYTYLQTGSTIMSILPLITHSNSSSLYCSCGSSMSLDH